MRQMQMTQEISSYLTRSLGEGTDVSKYAVFEAIAVNTLPIRKKHFLFKNAVISENTLNEMAASLYAESIPIQIMHEDYELPVGRAFHGKVHQNQGSAELRTLFWVDATETEIISKINSGTVDQVSVGMTTKSIQCSECGFDYLGPDATFDNIFEATCDEGHTLGENNVHAQMNGLDTWFELSLVNKGGAQNARIVRRNESAFTENSPVYALAANGVDPNLLVLNATPTKPERVDVMNLDNLVAELTDTKAKLITLEAKAEVAATKIEARDQKIANLENELTKIEELTAKLVEANARVEAAEAEVTELQEGRQADFDKIKDVVKTRLVQSGDIYAKALKSKNSVEELLSVLPEGVVQVSGGTSADADGTAEPTHGAFSNAFRSPTRRK